MSISHDLLRHVEYVQQCLSNDKKPIGLFLGAGCPVSIKTGDKDSPPLIPDIRGMTESVCDKLAKCKECGPLLDLINSHFKEDRRLSINIEDMLSHVRALRSVAGKSIVRNMTSVDLDKLDAAICLEIEQLTNKELPNVGTPYHQIAAWVGGTIREKPVQFFTTNYDLLLEKALEDCEVPYFDGFVGARRPFFDVQAMELDELPARWARLWKLHGSVNWYQSDSRRVYRSMSAEKGARRVIHPSHLKYEESRTMPYFAMIDRLRSFLKQSTATLVISGYSFRDGHLNREIVHGLQGNATAIVFALLFGKMDCYEEAIGLAINRPNLTLLADDGAVIGGQRAPWSDRDGDPSDEGLCMWSSWTKIKPEDENSRSTGKLLLGDFTVLGHFVQALVGRVLPGMESINAK